MKNLNFKGSSGFAAELPEEPIIPRWPAKVTYSIKDEVSEDGLTQTRGIEDIQAWLQDKSQERLDQMSLLKKQTNIENWERYVRGIYEITSGTTFEFTIQLQNRTSAIFEQDYQTTAAINFNSKTDENISIEPNIFRSVNGTYNFKPVLTVIKPGKVALMKVDFGNFGRYQTFPNNQTTEFLGDNIQYLIFVSRGCR